MTLCSKDKTILVDAELELKISKCKSWSLVFQDTKTNSCCDRDPFKKGDLKEVTAHLYGCMQH
jgi:hypothetical protein